MSGKVTYDDCMTRYTLDDILKYSAMIDLENEINSIINEDEK